MKTFCRLSAPGSSALSIWLVEGEADDCANLFDQHLPISDESFRLDRHTFPFDEALLWRRAQNGKKLTLECHLHGGYGVAAAFRAWMQQRGWKEEANGTNSSLEDVFLHANSPLAARVFGAHRKQAFALEMQRLDSLSPLQRRARIQEIQQWNSWAEVLESPPKIVLAGPPNVGKSSLFNLWNRAALATIQDGSGTTRDSVEAPILLGKEMEQTLFLLSDTAGIGEGLSVLDQQAMVLALEEVASAWMVIWVLDQHVAPNPVLRQVMSQRKNRDLVVLNRCDLESTWRPDAMGLVADLSGCLALGESWIAQLEACVLSRLGHVPPPGSLVAVKKSQREELEALLLASS
ncbi:MAG: 50S ribosome-binding GTPase [Planctomycetota bacterium]